MSQRQAVTKQVAARYRSASKTNKAVMLNESCATTGWSRDHARKALRTALGPRPARKALRTALGPRPARKALRPRPPVYGEEVLVPLRKVWAVLDAPAGKRLAPFLPEIVERLRACGELEPGTDWLTRNVASSDVVIAIESACSARPEYRRHAELGPKNAAVSAAAVTAAAAVVACPDPREASSALRRIPSREGFVERLLTDGASPVLTDVFHRSRRPPALITEIRYPRFSMFQPGPAPPDPGRHRLGRVPALLPREHVPNLIHGEPDLPGHILRWALAAAVCLTGSRIPITELCSAWGIRLGRYNLPGAIRRLTSAALDTTTLAELAHALSSPRMPVIDYTRRRGLDYQHLLPATEARHLGWPAALCTDPGLRQARRLAYELLCGNDPAHAQQAYRLNHRRSAFPLRAVRRHPHRGRPAADPPRRATCPRPARHSRTTDLDPARPRRTGLDSARHRMNPLALPSSARSMEPPVRSCELDPALIHRLGGLR